MKNKELLQRVLHAAAEIKAENPVVLDIEALSHFADQLVIVSGRSDRQVKAIADQILQELKKHGVIPLGVEGENQAHWILIDYGDVIVHVFYQETRDFYDLEGLWGDGKRLDPESLTPL